MELVKIQRRFQITLPKALREGFSLDVGDYMAVEENNGVISLVPMSVIPKDQRYFYSKEWQKGEAEADRDIAEGKVLGGFDNVDDAIDALHKASDEVGTK